MNFDEIIIGSDEKILYELFDDNNIMFCVTDKKIVARHCMRYYQMDIKEPLEIIDYKSYMMVIRNGTSVICRKTKGCIQIGEHLGLIEYDNCAYIFYYFTHISNTDFLMDIYNYKEKYYTTVQKLVKCSIPNFGGKSSEELLIDYLTEKGIKYDKKLVYKGTRIYKKYYGPNILRDHLCDLQIILLDH